MAHDLIEELASYVEDGQYEEKIPKVRNIDSEDVEKGINNIFENIGLTESVLKNAKQKPIFGDKVKLRARELLIAFFEIEKQFNISFTEEDINDYSFASINNIIECVERHMKIKESS